MSKAKILKALIEACSALPMPSVYDAFSAGLAQQAVQVSGFAVAAALDLPDIGILSLRDQINALQAVAWAVDTCYALIAPNQVTFDYIAAHTSLSEAGLRVAVDSWRHLRSDPSAVFDEEIIVAAEDVLPQVSWGTGSMHTVDLRGTVSDPQAAGDADAVRTARQALEYMQLKAGPPMQSIATDAAFIGSCTNARLSDLRAAAEILRGRKPGRTGASSVRPTATLKTARDRARELISPAPPRWPPRPCAATSTTRAIRCRPAAPDIAHGNRSRTCHNR